MASPANSEASEVRRRGRQRLIGAIALVAVLVVFVPMVLDKEPKRAGPDLAIPPKTNAPPLPAPPAAAKAPAAEGGKSAPQPPEVARQPRTDPKVAESKVLESKPPAPPKPPPAVVASAAPAPAPGTAVPGKAPPGQAPSGAQSTPRLEGFAVQVGAFRDESTLAQAREKLAAAKVPHYTERMEAKSGPLTRLRAGPFKTREAAESALAQLKLSALDGKVVPLP